MHQDAFKTLACAVVSIWMAVLSSPAFAAGTAERGMAFGLNGISDWSTQHPFIDLMKSARPWIGHLPGRWGGLEFETMLRNGVFDANGWPRRVPTEITKLETLVLTDQPDDASHLAGRYHVTFDGQGSLGVTGSGRVIKRGPGLRVFSYTPGAGAVGIAISATDVDDPIRNIRIVHERHLRHLGEEQVFNPLWLTHLQRTETVRFMDWMDTNNSTVQTWEDLPKTSDFSYAWRGVPLPVMIELANRIGADAWFALPHLSNDDLVRRFAQTVHDTLAPEQTVYVEYSNEVWNFIFHQAQWASQQAEKLWGEIGDGWMQFYGMRSAEIMSIWTEVFGEEANARLKRVVSVHTGWPELEKAALFGENATAALGRPPAEMFDAYAVTGYFGYELGEPATLQDVLDEAETAAELAGEAEGLSRVALREYVQQHRFDDVLEFAETQVRDGSLRELTETLWPYHAAAARDAGLELIMYEGGTHAAATGELHQDERLVAFLIAFNYSEQMGTLYDEALAAWARFTDSPFNAFVDVAPPSQWGSWGALRHLNDDNPRWRALKKHHSGQPGE